MAKHRVTDWPAASICVNHLHASQVLTPGFRAARAIADRTNIHARRRLGGSALTAFLSETWPAPPRASFCCMDPLILPPNYRLGRRLSADGDFSSFHAIARATKTRIRKISSKRATRTRRLISQLLHF